MDIHDQSEIDVEKSQVFKGKPSVLLTKACGINCGIIQLTEEQKSDATKEVARNPQSVCFFIPASGSGSRMFDDLFRLIDGSDVEPSENATIFFERISELALFNRIPIQMRSKLNVLDKKAIATYLLHREGLNLSQQAKGLIPFHLTEKGILNAFQEHALQVAKLFPNGGKLHFTVQNGVQDDALLSIKGLGREYIRNLEISFSVQAPSTDAYCFDNDQNPIKSDGEYLRRPAGHGALLKNLNSLEADYICIKNIDNVQHIDRCKASNENWIHLLGTLKIFQNELKALNDDFSIDGLVELNKKYQLIHDEDCLKPGIMSEIVSRPSRICGMVKNEGAPGGGPFWVKDGNSSSKQIVEKVQISSDSDQQEILMNSTHFNPVIIVASKLDCHGKTLDFRNFRDESKCLIVKKMHKGKEIHYRELPGLWNGGMQNWNTIFVELPSSLFSPVKTILDLLSPEHCAES